MIDRYSGYGWAGKLNSTSTEKVTDKLAEWFYEHGWPRKIRSDGGPQFRSEFKQFCESHGIQHELSSAYNSRSNGLAESGVKSLKKLVLSCGKGKFSLAECIASWRNMSRADGCSPSQLFNSRRQRQSWPLAQWQEESIQASLKKKDERHTDSLRYRNRGTKKYAKLRIGEKVRIYDTIKSKWLSTGTIISERDSGSSYEVEDSSGRLTTRNVRYLKPVTGQANKLHQNE